MILLHKVEAVETVRLMHQFSKFANIKTFKPSFSHKTKSSFYMVATNIQPAHPECISAVESWRKTWEIETFGTDEEYQHLLGAKGLDMSVVLDELGGELVRMGKKPWTIQAVALEKASWNKGPEEETGLAKQARRDVK